jgi:transcriptional regulator with XRE-family HTH domain
MKDISLRTAEQLGTVIRLKRKEKGLSQSALAELLGVNRKWVLYLEAGNPSAEIGLVLKAIAALDLRLSLSDKHRSSSGEAATSRLDEVFQRLQRPARK